ncbi:MAG: Rne/Rng family ribonuclease [Cryobacterium sp.]|nr:Rne/Rng family ribonuclease [Oligoflexia bacterium]
MATELIVNASLPETRIALMENGEIQEILIERAQGKGIVGNIYKGRVTRVLPGMQAAFVDIGLEKAAFLYVDDVFVHSDIWAEEEGGQEEQDEGGGTETVSNGVVISGASLSTAASDAATEPHLVDENHEPDADAYSDEEEDRIEASAHDALGTHPELLSEEEAEDEMAAHLADDEEEEDDDGEPVGMDSEGDDDEPHGTLAPASHSEVDEEADQGDDQGNDSLESSEAPSGEASAEGVAGAEGEAGRRRRRGRRGGRNRKRGKEDGAPRDGVARVEGAPREVRKVEVKTSGEGPAIIALSGGSSSGSSNPSSMPSQSGGSHSTAGSNEEYPDSYHEQLSEDGLTASDRASLGEESVSNNDAVGTDGIESNRPEGSANPNQIRIGSSVTAGAADSKKTRPEFKETRTRDRKIRAKQTTRPSRMNVNIQDLLKEGQEVIVQVAKDPIATKGARLTCHISLPGRHLVCMPTIDHVGVSRRIEKDEERRRLREYVDRNRPKGLGFIVRTATSSGKTKAEARIKQDIDYLSALWSEIKSKANAVTAPALVYEDLNPVLRAIRDWVNEDIDKIVVDSRYHYNDVQRFVRNFMPGIQSKAELYQGDLPIFDTYGISTELARALERKVWLKSGGYLVIDQAEALVAIDVNTGRYVGKKNLEDTILKTNLEAVKEIAYQLRLRNCGGIIILDLIDMDKEENKLRVYRALEEELKKDRSRPQILKISELGLVEMTRKRTRDTMVRALCDSCPHCEGKGYIKSKLTVAYEILRDIEREGVERDSPKLLVQAHPDVIDTLAIDERESLDQLERRYKKQIYLQAVQDLHLETFELIGDKRASGARSEESLLERARELAQTSDPRRGRRGRGREKTGGKDRNSSSNREGSGDRNAERGDRDSARKSGGREKNETRVSSNRPRISIRPGVAGGAPVDSDTQPLAVSGAEGENAPVVNRIQITPKSEQPASEAGNSDPNFAPFSPRPVMEDDFTNDEDRLAYQRAQAAQDAALAGVVAGNGNRAPTGSGRGGGKWAGKAGAPGGKGSRDPRAPKARGAGRRGRFQGGVRAEGSPGSVGAPGPTSGGMATSSDNGGGDTGNDSGSPS